MFAGCCQRSGPGHPQHLQCAHGLYHLLVNLRNHGCSAVRRKIFQGKIFLDNISELFVIS